MPTLNLSIDELLTITRAVRKRLDLTRPVEAEVIRECLSLALQAPTPGGMQNWHFLVVTDPSQRASLAALYRESAHAPGGQEDILAHMMRLDRNMLYADGESKLAQGLVNHQAISYTRS